MKIYVGVIAIVLALLVAGCVQGGAAGTPQQPPGANGAPAQAPAAVQQGRIVFAIADAATKMDGIQSINVTVDSLQVHSVSKGWITLSSAQKTYDLLRLKASGSQELLADVTLDGDAYDEVNIHISRVAVTDGEGEHDAKLPSGDLKIRGNFRVKGNATSAFNFDFAADRSLHRAGNGKYILAPVVRVRHLADAKVEVDGRNEVSVSGGKVDVDMEVGMNERGEVGAGLEIPAAADVSMAGEEIRVASSTEVNASGRILPDPGVSEGKRIKVGSG